MKKEVSFVPKLCPCMNRFALSNNVMASRKIVSSIFGFLPIMSFLLLCDWAQSGTLGPVSQSTKTRLCGLSRVLVAQHLVPVSQRNTTSRTGLSDTLTKSCTGLMLRLVRTRLSTRLSVTHVTSTNQMAPKSNVNIIYSRYAKVTN